PRANDFISRRGSGPLSRCKDEPVRPDAGNDRAFSQSRGGVYVVVALSLAAGTWSAVANLLDRRADIAVALDVLVQLESQQQRNTHSATIQVPFGSPLLEGTTVTVAGASLLQRVSAAITRLGGNILSSQVELQGVEARQALLASLPAANWTSWRCRSCSMSL